MMCRSSEMKRWTGLLFLVVVQQLAVTVAVDGSGNKQPQVYWASEAGGRPQGPQQKENRWSQVIDNHLIDRDWKAGPSLAPAQAPAAYAPAPAPASYASAPAPAPAPAPYAPAPAPASYVLPAPPATPAPYVPPATPAPYVPPATPAPYVPPATPAPYAPPAPASYDPAPASYDPAPAIYDPAPAPYEAPAPAATSYNAPPPSSSYDVPASPGGPAPNGYYQQYYYYPTKSPSPAPASGWKDLMGYEGEYLKTLWPGKELLPGQKVWLAVLAPLIIVALVVPLVAILFSGFTVTTNGRNAQLNPFEEVSNELGDLAGRVLRSEECVQRLVCQLGSYAADVPYTPLVLPFVEAYVPSTMKNNLAIFEKAAKAGVKGSDVRASQCVLYKCSMWNF